MLIEIALTGSNRRGHRWENNGSVRLECFRISAIDRREMIWQQTMLSDRGIPETTVLPSFFFYWLSIEIEREREEEEEEMPANFRL